MGINNNRKTRQTPVKPKPIKPKPPVQQDGWWEGIDQNTLNLMCGPDPNSSTGWVTFNIRTGKCNK